MNATNRPPLKIKTCPKCGSNSLRVTFRELLLDYYVNGEFHDTAYTQNFQSFNSLCCEECGTKITGEYTEAFDCADETIDDKILALRTAIRRTNQRGSILPELLMLFFVLFTVATCSISQVNKYESLIGERIIRAEMGGRR